jgi:DNA polymerase III epsilon subunit-like protein
MRRVVTRAKKKPSKPERLAVVYDTETTGLIMNRSMPLERLPEVIEFYGVLADLNSGKKKDEFHTLIKPSRPLSPMPVDFKSKKTITDITGITNDMLKLAPSFREVSGRIFKFLEEAPLVIAQNASFDRDIIDIEAERLGLELEWPPIICTIEQTVHLKGYRLSLSALHEHLFGKAFSGAHRAKADTEALVRCCVELVKRGEL